MFFKMLDAQLHLPPFCIFTTNYSVHLHGKIKAYSLFIITIFCIYRYTSVEIKPELKFGYGINYKSKGMLAHSFNRYYVITKFILPTIEDLKLSKLKFDNNFEHLRERNKQLSEEVEQHISDL